MSCSAGYSPPIVAALTGLSAFMDRHRNSRCDVHRSTERHCSCFIGGTATSAIARAGKGHGSFLLIPMACSFFGICNDVVMQAVAVGFIIGVVQDSVETALNSSGDVFFTATAEEFDRKKKGE